MTPPVPLPLVSPLPVTVRRLALALVLACAATAQGLTLEVAARLSVTGPSGVTEARWLGSSGARAVCLGARLVVLDRAGQVSRVVPTPPLCQGLTVSPSGQRATTVQDDRVNVWDLETGELWRTVPAQNSLGKLGFSSDDTLLLGGSGGVQAWNLADGTARPLRQEPVLALRTSPDGQEAVLADEQAGRGRVQLVDTATLTSLAATLCDQACPLGDVNFGSGDRVAVVRAGTTLYALRAGYPSSTVLRQAPDASGLPLRLGTVLTFQGGAVESRDLQTGRRERTLAERGWAAQPVQLLALPGPGGTGPDTERVLALTGDGQLVDADTAWQDIRRTPLPAVVGGGGLDSASGAVVTRTANGVARVGERPVSGTFWDTQTMNKSTWALTSDGQGGLALNLLTGGSLGSSGSLRRLPSVPSHTHLSVNHWGNHAATWDDDTAQVVSQATGKVTATFTPPAGLLQDAQVTLSPDATRAFVFPANAAPYLVTLNGGQRSPLPVPPAGDRLVGVQISGQGILAFASRRDLLSLYRPKATTPYATVDGSGTQARFSNDSLHLATPVTTPAGPRVNVINVETGEIEASTPPLAQPPSFLTWSTDSKRLVVGAGLMDDLSSVTVFNVK